MPLELCLFRHGRTTWNAARRYQGQADIELDALGQAQVVAIAERARGMAASALYSSDLRRCLDVATAIAEVTGLELEKDVRLRERDVGAWSGLTANEISRKFPEEWEAWTEGREVRPGGGESTGQIWDRAESFLADIRNRHDDGTVIAVTHGGWIRIALQQVIVGRPESLRMGVAGQGALTVFNTQDGEPFKLEAFNDRGHLLGVEPVDQEAPAPAVY